MIKLSKLKLIAKVVIQFLIDYKLDVSEVIAEVGGSLEQAIWYKKVGDSEVIKRAQTGLLWLSTVD